MDILDILDIQKTKVYIFQNTYIYILFLAWMGCPDVQIIYIHNISYKSCTSKLSGIFAGTYIGDS